MCIDIKLGSIEWQVGGLIRHKLTFPLLRDTNIKWAPLIIMNNKDDSCEISE